MIVIQRNPFTNIRGMRPAIKDEPWDAAAAAAAAGVVRFVGEGVAEAGAKDGDVEGVEGKTGEDGIFEDLARASVCCFPPGSHSQSSLGKYKYSVTTNQERVQRWCW